MKQLPFLRLINSVYLDFLSLRGGEEVIEALRILLENDKGKKALDELKQMWKFFMIMVNQEKE